MDLDYRPSNTWEQFNNQVKDYLVKQDILGQPRIFRGLQHALMEVTAGLVKQFPHKKTIYYLKNVDPIFEPVVVQLASDGLPVESLDVEVLSDPQAWVNGLGQEVLMVIVTRDVPFIGKTYDLTPLYNSIRDKRIFLVECSHTAHRFAPLKSPIGKYHVTLNSFGETHALALAGDRTRFPNPITQSLYWSDEEVQQFYLELESKPFDKKSIQDFEANPPADAKALYANSEQHRLFDRSLIYWEDMDGWAFVHEVQKLLGLPFQPAGLNTELETASLSRWGGVRTMDWLKSHGLTPEQIRGLVAISVDLIKNSDFRLAAETARKNTLKLQYG